VNKSRFSVSRETTLRAQKLRREATPYEKRLWAALRDGLLGGRKFRRQHPVGPYILDFYCTVQKLCIELDGDSHGHAAAIVHDARRTDYLAEKGIRVLRFTNEDVSSDLAAVVDAILSACENCEGRR
jgi:very-short-patch-repair endonuclease